MLLELRLKVLSGEYCGNIKVTVNVYETKEFMQCNVCDKNMILYIGNVMSVIPNGGFSSSEAETEFKKLASFQIDRIIRNLPRCAVTSLPDEAHENYIKNLFFLSPKYEYLTHLFK